MKYAISFMLLAAAIIGSGRREGRQGGAGLPVPLAENLATGNSPGYEPLPLLH